MILVAVVMLAGISLHASSASCGDVHRLAAEGDVDGLRRMLDDDPSLVSLPDDEWKALPIHWASFGGSAETVRFLLERGADTASMDGDGNVPVDFAFMRGGEDALLQLVESGADLSRVDRDGLTPLVRAAWLGWTRAVEAMIAADRSPGERTAAGDTPLHGAAYEGHRATVERLLDLGADAGSTNDAGETPVDEALKRGEEDVAALLRDRGGAVGTQAGKRRFERRPWKGARSGRCERPRLTVVYDNYPFLEGCTEDWGFSCLVECPGATIMFDTGARPEIFMRNLRVLGIDPSSIDAVVISHEHHDHTGGLRALIEAGCEAPVLVCRSFSYGFVRSVESLGVEVLTLQAPSIVADGVYLTGELGDAIREQALVLDTGEALHVVCGCSHPGIVHMLEHVESTFGAPLDLVIGGFHLMNAGDRTIDGIVRRFGELGVKRLSATHCTGERQIGLLREAFGDRFVEAGVGRVIEP